MDSDVHNGEISLVSNDGNIVNHLLDVTSNIEPTVGSATTSRVLVIVLRLFIAFEVYQVYIPSFSFSLMELCVSRNQQHSDKQTLVVSRHGSRIQNITTCHQQRAIVNSKRTVSGKKGKAIHPSASSPCTDNNLGRPS